jgi:hypothetical protein
MKSCARKPLAALAMLALLLTINSQSSTVLAQGTAFTYQGQLQNNGTLANGTFNLQFTLYTNSVGGTAVAGPVTTNGVSISNGLFTVAMDFGATAWNGATNWLQISVETNGGSSFSTLSPRQEITPTPYAIFAEGANAAGLSGTIPMANLSGTYGAPLNLTNPGNNFAGNGGGLTNLNAATLAGLSASNFWQLGGNNVASGQFLGTLNAQPLDFYVNNLRALRLILKTDATGIYSNAPDVIGGSSSNQVSVGVVGATIGGGGGMDIYGGVDVNTVTANFGTVSGGEFNQANGQFSTVCGGGGNNASGDYATASGFLTVASGEWSTVGGGDQNAATNQFATVAGGLGNGAFGNGSTVGGGTGGTASGATATIAGGNNNTASGVSATVGGGIQNTASGEYSTVSGGSYNTASAIGSFIGGGGYDGIIGSGNQVQSRAATICGGIGNMIPSGAIYSTIGGGCYNNASGNASTICGGSNNAASGNYSFAAGALASAKNDYSFVWADNEGGSFSSSRSQQFAIQAANGVYMSVSGSSGLTPAALEVNSTSSSGVAVYAHQGSSGSSIVTVNTGTGDLINGFSGPSGGSDVFTVQNDGTVVSKGVVLTSDRNAKENFADLDPGAVLAKVAAMPVTEWNYRTDPAGTKHIGPVAQDFHTAFGLNGADDKHISVVDEGGVALAAIQGLNHKLEADNERLQAQISDLQSKLDGLQQVIARLAKKSSDKFDLNPQSREVK